MITHTPSGQTPSGQTPSGQTPSGQTPSGQTPSDRADAELRALVAQIDPEAGTPMEAPDYLLERVLAGDHSETTARTVSPSGRRSFLRRHWQGAIMAAAAVLTVALAAGTVLPGLAGGTTGSDAGQAAAESSGSAAGAPADAVAGAGGSGVAGDMALADTQAPGGAARDSAEPPANATAQDQAKNTLVRSASLLVGTEDIDAARNSFVAMVLSNGGRITSETVVSDGARDPVYLSGYPAGSEAVGKDMGLTYPYPYPSGPGTWLTVQVPAEHYDATVQAARALGEVVQMQQSSYDVGTQMTDVDARIASLEASLKRLQALMGEAKDVSDVIKLESAIAERQAELDSLKAQQRDLATETAMSSVSLTLMSPDDAKQTVSPQPEPSSWWQSFLNGLTDLWSWLGQALLIVSPLLIGAAIIWWVRRRQRRTAATPPSEPMDVG